MMTNGDHEGRIVLSNPRTHGGYVFLLTTNTSFFLKNKPEKGYADMRHGDVILTLQ